MKKYNNIETFRFLFSILIVLMHILNRNIIPYTGGREAYITMQGMCIESRFLVECFLIIAGYFLYTSFQKRKSSCELSFIEFAFDKVARLWPVLAVSVVSTVIFEGPSAQRILMDLSFLRCTGISEEIKGIIWYVGPFFWGSLLVFQILKCFDKSKAGLILAVLAYFGYAVNINAGGGLGRKIVLSFICLGLFRVISGISVGCLIGMGREAYIEKFGTPENSSKAKTAVISVIELTSFIVLMMYCLIGCISFSNPFSIVIIFTVLFICLLDGRGILSKLANNKVLSYPGRYAYSIYMMQQPAFYILSKTFWQSSGFLYDHPVMATLISTALTVVFGIITYYLIEAPAASFYKKWKENRLTPKTEDKSAV
ncbi:MAG: acyltransferase [Huintestinicola sp.]